MAPANAPPAQGAVAAGQGEAGGANGAQEEGFFNGNIQRVMLQMFLFTMILNTLNRRTQNQQMQMQQGLNLDPNGTLNGSLNETVIKPGKGIVMRNLYGPAEDCDLWVHYSLERKAPPLEAVVNKSLALEEGYELLWHQGVWYEANAEPVAKNVSIGPLPLEALSPSGPFPYIHATLIKRSILEAAKTAGVSDDQVIQQSLPLVVLLRELDANAGATSLFGGDEEENRPVRPVLNLTRPKLPYFKTKLDIRPVFDQSEINLYAAQQGPFQRLQKFPELGVYQPALYISDFWMLEKEYLPLNETLADRQLNLTLSYSIINLFTWSIQVQMAEQWMVQGEWGFTDTQRDSFMLKRLYLDTNPWFLAFSACFLMLHTVFSMLAFKNDIQFWQQNKSMQGLSARSMIISWVCQLITALYLLDSQETSRLILFEICLDTSLSFWKLKKAVKIERKKSFPFVSFGGQEGYEKAGTNKYDEEAIQYMMAIITPFFIGYAIRSALYGKHRGWYSFLVSTAAGGVYTFGFVMMTPQLYINYKLKSVEHLPWRALSYKAMNTFVDDVAAFLIDMPIMHRLSCFRDDIVFFVYIYQRWKYRVDKTRPSVWVEGGDSIEGEAAAALPADAAASSAEASSAEASSGDSQEQKENPSETKEEEGKLRERKKKK